MENILKSGCGNPSGKRRILVADDEATLRLGISYTLANDDTHVDLAEDGAEALEILAVQEYDLLIMDLRMPSVDGITVIEALRTSANRVPVILCSAEFTPGTCLRAVRCDVLDFLIKPANPVQIRSAVDFVLEAPTGYHAQAMAAARAGEIGEAIRIFESANELDTVSQGWMKVFRSLDSDAGTAESGNTITEQEFAALAFNV